MMMYINRSSLLEGVCLDIIWCCENTKWSNSVRRNTHYTKLNFIIGLLSDKRRNSILNRAERRSDKNTDPRCFLNRGTSQIVVVMGVVVIPLSTCGLFFSRPHSLIPYWLLYWERNNGPEDYVSIPLLEFCVDLIGRQFSLFARDFLFFCLFSVSVRLG